MCLVTIAIERSHFLNESNGDILSLNDDITDRKEFTKRTIDQKEYDKGISFVVQFDY